MIARVEIQPICNADAVGLCGRNSFGGDSLSCLRCFFVSAEDRFHLRQQDIERIRLFDIVIAADVEGCQHILVAAACADEQNRHIVCAADLLAELKARALTEIDIQQQQRDSMLRQKRLRPLIAGDICRSDIEDIEILRSGLRDGHIVVDHQTLILHDQPPACCTLTALPVSPINAIMPSAGRDTVLLCPFMKLE